MKKKLSCWLGRHEWTTRIEQGQSYKICSICGKMPRNPGNPPMSGTDVTWSKMGPD